VATPIDQGTLMQQAGLRMVQLQATVVEPDSEQQGDGEKIEAPTAPERTANSQGMRKPKG
jgi:hypothetical protein